jgi:hypothetical protein
MILLQKYEPRSGTRTRSVSWSGSRIGAAFMSWSGYRSRSTYQSCGRFVARSIVRGGYHDY